MSGATLIQQQQYQSGIDSSRIPVLERFWAKVDKSGADGCWTWKAALDTHRYPQFWLDGRLVGAHRFSYELVKGPVPKGHELHHTCGRRACIRPEHLVPMDHDRHMELHGLKIPRRTDRDRGLI